MKSNKIALVICAAILSVFTAMQLGYAYTAMVNLGQQTDGSDVAKKVEDAVKDAGQEGKKFASNTMFGAEMADELRQNKDAAVVRLNGADLRMAVSNVTSPADYAIGMVSVGLASRNVSVEGNTYDFSDSSVSPLLFSENFAVGEIQRFSGAVDSLQPDQIAVIVAINMSADEIRQAIDGKVNLDRVVIVQATTRDSQEAFLKLFEDNKEGFSLKDLNRNDRAVVKALEGAI